MIMITQQLLLLAANYILLHSIFAFLFLSFRFNFCDDHRVLF